MVDYDKFRLTDEDINIGIEDFLTQLLIEARRQRSEAKTLRDLASKSPTVIYVSGQPGAGKTTLGKYVEGKYRKEGECTVEISSDKIATYHKHYDELLKLLPDDCYTLSRQFVRVAEPTIYDKVRSNKLNIIREIGLTKGEKDYKEMQRFKDSGYDIEINIMAIDKYESFLSCIERDIKLLELGFDPRPVARVNHDRMYDPIIQELIEIQKRGLSTRINVFTRGESIIRPKLEWTTGDTKYPNAQEALISERTKGRRNLLRNPQAYLQRISEAREKIELMIQDEKMKKSYLEGLKQLEKEFINELSFNRSFEE